ncbi:MAG: endonuclease MutS2 [Gemmatimonadota bacterium]
MNSHALSVLQYPEALQIVASYASSTLGADAVRSLTPATSPDWIETELRRVDEMAALLLRAEPWGMPAIPDVRAALRKLSVAGSALDGGELRDCAQLLRSTKEVRNVVLRTRNLSPLLAAVAEPLAPLEKLERQIENMIDDAGAVRDTAARDLSRIRRELRGARAKIVSSLEAYIGTLPTRAQVADASVTIRDGRYVVPIRRDARAEIGGIVRDESATGNTLFVEPPIAIELMNRLRELEIAEAREVQRILRELTATARPHEPELRIDLENLMLLDSLHARARYARAHDGHRPQIAVQNRSSEPQSRTAVSDYVVVNGSHPLLLAQARSVVPFDLVMDPEERTLLVSGPNTGGKTVLLKAIGLISALTQAGIIPPVGPGTRVPVFDDVFADIGDEQSIEASLSTFSAHLKNLREILEQANADSLVLIDEMGSGTDPAEGGALAQSILVELTRRGTVTVATTHLGQLKLIAGSEPGVVNASLQFDAAQLRPTYRLQKGVPGRSYGLAIARRLGFPNDVLTRAEAELPHAELELSRLLAELETKEAALAAALAETTRAKEELDALKQSVEERDQVIRKRERDAERRARQQARDLLLNAREEVEASIRELRSAVGAHATQEQIAEAARAARHRVEQTARMQAERMPAEQPQPAPLGPVEAGATVQVVASGAVGKLVELRAGRALVETGGLRIQVPATGLVRAPEPKREKAKVKVGTWGEADFNASSEVNLIGLRVDEAITALTQALDAAVRAALPSLRIVHGKGTGALRKAVAELLQSDPRVKAFRAGGPTEGGTGVTMAELQ